jgi:hypothetical protein
MIMATEPNRDIVLANNIIPLQDLNGFPYDPRSLALFHSHFKDMLVSSIGAGYKKDFHVAYNVVRAADYIDDRLCQRKEELDLTDHTRFTLERIRPDSLLRRFSEHPWKAEQFEELEYGVMDLLGGDIICLGSFQRYDNILQIYSHTLKRFAALRLHRIRA